MTRFLVSGHGVTGDVNGFALVLTHVDCGDSLIAGYSGGAPTLDQLCAVANAHSCGQDNWRRVNAADLAAL